MQTSTFRRVFKAFHYRDFRLMWIGACTSSVGTWMQIVAQGWLIYRLTHSSRLLALDQVLGGLPIFLFSILGGVVADRVGVRIISQVRAGDFHMSQVLIHPSLQWTGVDRHERTGRL